MMTFEIREECSNALNVNQSRQNLVICELKLSNEFKFERFMKNSLAFDFKFE